MSIIEAIAQSAYTEVQAGGLRWRLSVVRSEDLIRGGVAMLSLLPSRIDGEPAVVADEAARAMAGNVDAAIRLRGLADGMVCAAVRAVAVGDEWEPVSLVLEESMVDSAASPPRVWIASLPIDVRDALYRAAMAHNTDGGRLANALESFRAGSDGAPADRPAGATVRPHAA